MANMKFELALSERSNNVAATPPVSFVTVTEWIEANKKTRYNEK